jgi:hypothetical protein
MLVHHDDKLSDVLIEGSFWDVMLIYLLVFMKSSIEQKKTRWKCADATMGSYCRMLRVWDHHRPPPIHPSTSSTRGHGLLLRLCPSMGKRLSSCKTRRDLLTVNQLYFSWSIKVGHIITSQWSYCTFNTKSSSQGAKQSVIALKVHIGSLNVFWIICDKVYKELTIVQVFQLLVYIPKWIASLVSLKKLEKRIGYLNS